MAIKTITAIENTTQNRMWSIIQFWGRAAASIVPALLLFYFSIAHFEDGLAVDRAIPVPVFMIQQIKMPAEAYIEAIKELERASPQNGLALIARAEAEINIHGYTSNVVALLKTGLTHAPSSSRGWTLLAEAYEGVGDRKSACRALYMALILSPRDYWLGGARAIAASDLWSDLDQDTRQMAISQTRLLWNEPILRDQLRVLVRRPNGAALATRAFDQNEVRRINRWLQAR